MCVEVTDSSKIISTSPIIIQSNGRAYLFHVPLNQENSTPERDLTEFRQLEQRFQQILTPRLLMKPFMKNVVGTSRVVGVVSQCSILPTKLGNRVAIEDFREDTFLAERFQSIRDVSGSLRSSDEGERCSSCEHQRHKITTIRVVVDKEKISTYLLILSSIALMIGIVVGLTFPHAEIGSIISTGTIGFAGLLQACVAWCQQ